MGNIKIYTLVFQNKTFYIRKETKSGLSRDSSWVPLLYFCVHVVHVVHGWRHGGVHRHTSRRSVAVDRFRISIRFVVNVWWQGIYGFWCGPLLVFNFSMIPHQATSDLCQLIERPLQVQQSKCVFADLQHVYDSNRDMLLIWWQVIQTYKTLFLIKYEATI